MTAFGVLMCWKMFGGLDFPPLLKWMLKIPKALWPNITTGEADNAVTLNLETHITNCYVLLSADKNDQRCQVHHLAFSLPLGRAGVWFELIFLAGLLGWVGCE